MIICKSNTIYDGGTKNYHNANGEMAAFYIPKNTVNVIIRRFNFISYRYGVFTQQPAELNQANTLASNILIEDCSMSGSYKNLMCTLAFGGQYVTMRRCKVFEGPRLALSGDGSHWHIDCCLSHDCDDTSIYLRGGGHLVTNCQIEDTGKDGIKIRNYKRRPETFEEMQIRSTVYNCFVRNYGLKKPDAGAAYSTDRARVTFMNNRAELQFRGVLEDRRKLRGFRNNNVGNVYVENLVTLAKNLGAVLPYDMKDTTKGDFYLPDSNEVIYRGTR